MSLTDSLTQTSELSLITLSDGRSGVRTSLATESRQAPDVNGKPIIEFVASDETLDRCGETISAAGWKLEGYQRNPVFQNAHKYGDIIFTLGRALITEVREVGPVAPRGPSRLALFQRVEFAVDINPMAKIAYGLYKGKFLNAVSVGFVPLRWEDSPSSSASASASASMPRRRYLEQELLEVSAVGIPANPNALALGLKSGAIEKSDIKDTLDLLQSLWSAPAERSGDGAFPSPVHTASPLNHQLIFQLTRDLHALIRRA